MKFNLMVMTLFVSLCSYSSEVSIYDANLGEFHSDTGKSVHLKDFLGKKVVVAMVYTSCQMACPMMIKKLKKIESKLKEIGMEPQFVVVSFDSKFDTTERLASFRKNHSITGTNWTLMVGSEKDTRFLSNLLEIRFSRNPKDQTISHDNKVVFLDEKGQIVRTQEGLTFDPLEKIFN